MRPVRPVREHGRHIYAYCNIRTKQVIYSLSAAANSHAAIKQLPDLGANNTPTALRKDLWKPLYTLSLPTNSESHRAQGLDAFRKLREYRKLHELNWEPPLALSKPYSDAEIEDIKDALQQRGGNKKETPYDIIKRRKRRMRERVIMDQKANSVADLAAVLWEQEEAGKKTLQAQRELRRGEVEEMLGLAIEASRGEIEEVDRRIAEAKRMIEEKEAPEGMSRNELKANLHRMMSKRGKMVFADSAVKGLLETNEMDEGLKKMMADLFITRAEDRVKSWKQKAQSADAEDTAGHAKKLQKAEADLRERMQTVREFFGDLQTPTGASPPTTQANAAATGRNSSPKRILVPYVPGEAPALRLSKDSTHSSLGPASEDQANPDLIDLLPPFPARTEKTVPKRGPLSARIKRQNAPVFGLEGVKVKWQHTLDAEYAASWPSSIIHEPMGWVRHNAPKGDMEAIEDVAILNGRAPRRPENKSGSDVLVGEGEGGPALSTVKRERIRGPMVERALKEVLDEVNLPGEERQRLDMERYKKGRETSRKAAKEANKRRAHEEESKSGEAVVE